jgi:O-antigen/teichoic acid export membrane protein
LTAIGFVSQAKLQRQFKNKELTLITGFSTALGMIVSLTLVLFSYGAWAIVIGRIVHSLLLAILLQKTELFLPTKVQIKKHHFKKIFSFCLPIFLQLVLYFVSARGVLLATLALLGNAQFAIMAIAQRAFRALSDVTATPLNAILLNSFSRLASLEQKQNAYEKVIRVSSAIIFPMFIGLALVSYEVVELAFGIKWKESSVLLSIMSFSILFMLPTWFLTSLLTSEGLTRQVLTMNIINATIIATSTLIGASFSLFHTALSLVFAEFILIFLKFWYVTRYLNLDTVSILKSLVPSLTSSLFMFFFVYVALIFMHSDISLPILLIIKIVLGIFSYSIFYLTFFNKSFTALKEELLPIFKK